MALLSLECTRCKYKFSNKAIPTKCPYCSKEGCIQKAQTAQDLIDEALSEAEFYSRDKD
jgi:predicted Zn-ribbon and HTH transcriptional regulator